MHDETTLDDLTSQADSAEQSLEVDMGRALPPAHGDVPALMQPEPRGAGAANATLGPSTIVAQGMHFTGHILLSGPCSVGGEIEGHLMQSEGADVAVVIAPTGVVKGDITARRISVLGQTEGLLDAGAGEVSLHDGARVQGRVRYGRIQVNGADLNATLERVATPRP
jgi:cytoskeletal protein CcmA (bactofilin family)